MVQIQDLMNKIQIERWSEEEYLLEYDKYSSNIYSNNQGDLPRSSSDRHVHHEHAKKRRIQKYLKESYYHRKESYYHRIECIAATFLAAFIWRRLLNSAALATTTHKKLRKVSDGTCTQVRAQMTNKCKIKMV